MSELAALQIDKIGFGDVQAFCSHETPENIRLEYKAQFSNKDPAKQIAKEVAAFANTQGGTILFGVAEASDRRPVRAPTGANLGDNPRATIQSACAHHVFPPIIPDVSEFIRNPADPSLGFVVVRVGASEDIHTVERGTGIYVRINDQSEPQAADLERIDWMLQRRSRAVSLQTERRERIMSILKHVRSDDSIGSVEVTIGPKIITDPLTDPRGLRDNLGAYSVQSNYFNGESVPIPTRQPTRSMSDGIYGYNGYERMLGESAGAVDVFGNFALRTQLLQPLNFDGPRLDGFERPIPKLDGGTVGFDAATVIERVLCLTQASGRFYSAVGFVGIVELTVHVPLVSDFPLVWCKEHWPTVMGFCARSDEILVRATMTTSELSTNPTEAMNDLVLRLLWSWGCMRPEMPQKVIELALRYLRGGTPSSRDAR